LGTAWTVATDQERSDHLDRIGRAELCRLMSTKLKTEFVDAVIGLDVANGSASSDIAIGLTRILRHGLSIENENEKITALGRFIEKLAANKRTLHDVAIALVEPKKKGIGIRKGNPARANPRGNRAGREGGKGGQR